MLSYEFLPPGTLLVRYGSPSSQWADPYSAVCVVTPAGEVKGFAGPAADIPDALRALCADIPGLTWDRREKDGRVRRRGGCPGAKGKG